MIIVDTKMPETAKEKLAEYGDLMELETSGITYPAISGHPDIFFCQTPAGLIVAPNLPEEYFNLLDQHNIGYQIGKTKVGNSYPKTAPYNAVVTSKYLIHNQQLTDPVLLDACLGLVKIRVKQGYTRCNLFALGEKAFITSDKGIYATLLEQGLTSYYFSPEEIALDGFQHGFLGGACGIWGQKVFTCGSLRYHSRGQQLKEIIEKEGFEITELLDRPLMDVGSIVFVNDRTFEL